MHWTRRRYSRLAVLMFSNQHALLESALCCKSDNLNIGSHREQWPGTVSISKTSWSLKIHTTPLVWLLFPPGLPISIWRYLRIDEPAQWSLFRIYCSPILTIHKTLLLRPHTQCLAPVRQFSHIKRIYYQSKLYSGKCRTVSLYAFSTSIAEKSRRWDYKVSNRDVSLFM